MATGSYKKLINKAIKSFIDSELFLAVALQVSGLVNKKDKEAKETEEEIDEAFKLKSV